MLCRQSMQRAIIRPHSFLCSKPTTNQRRRQLLNILDPCTITSRCSGHNPIMFCHRDNRRQQRRQPVGFSDIFRQKGSAAGNSPPKPLKKDKTQRKSRKPAPLSQTRKKRPFIFALNSRIKHTQSNSITAHNGAKYGK